MLYIKTLQIESSNFEKPCIAILRQKIKDPSTDILDDLQSIENGYREAGFYLTYTVHTDGKLIWVADELMIRQAKIEYQEETPTVALSLMPFPIKCN